tara:strand:+ start:181 stop:462 length:282 start_codon:yes stop_codon:yes gene_type:complete
MDPDKKIKSYIKYKFRKIDNYYEVISSEPYDCDKDGQINELYITSGESFLDYNLSHIVKTKKKDVIEDIKNNGYILKGTTFYYNHNKLDTLTL